MSTLEDCRALLQERLPAVAAVILEARDAAGVPTTSFVAQLCDHLPAVPIIGYCDVAPRGGGDAVALVRAGVHDIVLRGVDDGAIALRDALLGASHCTAANRVMSVLKAIVHPCVLPLLEHCVRFGRRPMTVAAVAQALGVHRKTLVNQCSRAKLPPPAIVLGWCRLFLAAALLERKSYAIERIALELDYPSSTALRNTFRRYVGATATQVRSQGGLEFVLDYFEGRVKAAQSGVGERARWRRGTATEVATEAGQAGRGGDQIASD